MKKIDSTAAARGLRVAAFRGVRYDFRRTSLSRALCPPYDVIPEELALRLRRVPGNAIHLELPAGAGERRYRDARRLWERWREKGLLVIDERPAFYAVEQTFRFGGSAYRRAGVLAALGLDEGTARRVLPHERTLSNPKRDRARLLRALGVNTSPIFAIFSDPGRRLRGALDAVRRTRPLAAGRDTGGVAYRLWRVDSPERVERMERAFRSRRLLIADGHHRYEAAREHRRLAGRKGGGHVLAYLVAEEDPGLIVNPTHRVLRDSGEVRAALARHCASRAAAGLPALTKALARAPSPFAFGLYDGSFRLMLPARGDRGVASRFGTDWMARRLLASVDPQDISYRHQAAEAVREARLRRGLALLVKPFSVPDIRRAVARAGLLPQKSTYFYPKIATGLVFRRCV
ncbi:MAG: DUF1015 domain-containing protein [Elusimicrobiota bacterium]